MTSVPTAEKLSRNRFWRPFAAVIVVMTATIPNHLIAWRTAPRQPLRHSGVVRFDEISPERTRVEVQISYAPVRDSRALSPLGSDPGAALEEDLRRMKSLLDRRTARGGASSDAAETFLGESAGSVEEGLRAPAAEAPAPAGDAPVPRSEALATRPEEAIVAAQDVNVAPLIQEEPGQTEPYDEGAKPVGPEGSEATRKPARKRTRRKRGEGTDQPDL